MPRKPAVPGDEQQNLLQARVTTAPCVPGIRKGVDDWRRGKYRGASETTKSLFNYWFYSDHRQPSGQSFRYYDAQREALETIVWLYEVQGIRRHRDLIEGFAKVPGIHVLQYDEFARYAVKMATGSGKTKVMALAIAWQYFNAVAEGREDYAKTFLVVAPNVIVFERLRTDFGGGRVFRTDPIIPPELRIFWVLRATLFDHQSAGLSDDDSAAPGDDGQACGKSPMRGSVTRPLSTRTSISTRSRSSR